MEVNMNNEIKELLSYLTQHAIPIEDFGCYAAISPEGNLYYCPMLVDGTAEKDEEFPEYYDFSEVTVPDTEFLILVNKIFGTQYAETQFSGR